MNSEEYTNQETGATGQTVPDQNISAASWTLHDIGLLISKIADLEDWRFVFLVSKKNIAVAMDMR
jgi:hypothetical protein